MKTRRILCMLFAVVMMIGLLPGVSYAQENPAPKDGTWLKNPISEKEEGEAAEVVFDFPTSEAMLAAMKAVAENDRFILYYSPQTMAVALKEKQSGRLYTSNPYNAAADSGCVGNTEKMLESQVVLTYIDANVRQQKLEMYSSSDCVEKGQFAYTEYENGVSFSVTLGKASAGKLVPAAMTEAFFEEIVGKLEGRPARRMKVFYERYSLEDDLSQEDKESLIKRYPGVRDGAVYVALDLSERETKEVEKYIKEAGCTAEQIQKDFEKTGAKMEEEHAPAFSFDVEYALTPEGLTVRIPHSSIVYEADYFQLLSIKLLPFFGADAPQKGGEGYLFFPDGSGSVIEMDGQDANRRTLMTLPVYGFDAGDELDVDTRTGEPCYLPVFGIHRNDAGGFVSIIEQGDAVASVTAQLGQPNSSYYTVYPSFTIAKEKHIMRDAKVSSQGSSQMIYLFEKGHAPYAGDITVSYHVLEGQRTGYVDMAARYGEYLQKKGMTKSKEKAANVALTTVGTALYRADFLGFTYDKQAELTTYAQNVEMLKKLTEQGLKNPMLRLTGWQKNGLDGSVSNKVRLSSALGGKSAFKDLIRYTHENGIAFYPGADILFATTDRFFDGFSTKSGGIRQLDYTMGGVAAYQPDIDDFGDLRVGVSPSLYKKYFASFFQKYAAYEHPRISLETAGSYLNSDYNRKHGSNREETRKVMDELLRQYSKDYALSFTGANAYVLPYADCLTEISMTDSRYLGETYSVPFLQLAVSGYAQVQSVPLNLEEDLNRNLLRCMETGTVPSFTVCYGNIELLKQTDYSNYYSVSFAVQEKNILKAAAQYAQLTEATAGTKMTDHKRLADGVFLSAYENGTRVYVNYTHSDYVSDTITVAAEGFSVVKQ